MIDPAPNSAKHLLAVLVENEFSCEKILLTHSHWDHIADVLSIKKELPSASVYIHPLDTPNLEKPGADGIPFWIPIESVKADHLINDGDQIEIGNHIFSIIHTPGHSPGSLCLYCAKENVLFSGDTLFAGSIGNLSFPTCQPDLMWPSLTKLSQLPSKTKVYPGHGRPTTIGSEPWLSQAKEKFT